MHALSQGNNGIKSNIIPWFKLQKRKQYSN